VFGLILNNVSLAQSVEYGQDATGDPNVIDVWGSSGFLYSDRIVFTSAHVIMGLEPISLEESMKRIARMEREGSVYSPGIGDRAGQKQYKVKKVLINSTYKSRSGSDNTRIDDFAILILQESIPMKNKVVVASESDMAAFIKDKNPVYMVGYGLQNPSQRTPPQYGTLSPRKMTSYLVSNEELKNYYKNNSLSYWAPNQTILDYGVPNTEKFGSVCDGDSGAGFFVEKGDTRYYLGAVGGQQGGIPNCQTASWAIFGIGGGMSGFTATNKFLQLINEAESLVADDKQKEVRKVEEERLAAELKVKQEADERARVEAELKAKLEAEAKAAAELKAKQEAEVKAAALKKTTITCVKGKLTKKVTAVKPKCPTGYKKK
jgi:secreted trypsin-like serine protease